jgi:hypothetical protein
MPTTDREPLCTIAVLPFSSCALWHRSAGVTRPSQLILAHAPDHNPHADFGYPYFGRSLQVAASPLLEDGPSRRYLYDPCIGAWIPTPSRLSGALVRFFPDHIGLILRVRNSAREKYPANSFTQGRFLEAATIRLSSGSHTCSTLWLF